MEYINLIDYLDRPKLIKNENGRIIRTIHYFPKQMEDRRVVVVYECGEVGFYTEDGRLVAGGKPRFILKSKPKKTITGWRRGVVLKDGTIVTEPTYKPSKEEFTKYWGSGAAFFGDWEKFECEIEED